MSPLEQISVQLAGYPAKRMARGELRSAAVLVPLFLREEQPWILFTRRTEQLRNHSGESAFPGGGAEEQDSDFWATALRETEEEMGIRMADIRRLGQLDDFYSVYGYRVRVCVGSYFDPYPYRVDENEIAFANFAIRAGLWRVVRIAAVGTGTDDGRVIGEQIVLLEIVEDLLLHFRFARRAAVFDLAGNKVECHIKCRCTELGRFLMHLPLLIIPARFE